MALNCALNGRLDLLGLYSQKYMVSRSVDLPAPIADFGDSSWLTEPHFLLISPRQRSSPRGPACRMEHDAFLKEICCSQAFREGSTANTHRNARLAKSFSKRRRSKPTHDGTPEYPSHGFQISYFDGTTPALSKVLLKRQRICCVQFSVEKRVENDLPFRTRAGCTHTGFVRRRHAHQSLRKLQLAPGLTMIFPFMFGWIKHA